MILPHRKTILLALLILLLPAILSCSPKEQELLKRTQFIMGTLVEITVREPDQRKAQSAISLAFDEMRRLEKLMSTHLPDSEISRLNAKAGAKASLTASPEVLEVIRRGIYWGNQSNGALDISIGPVSRLWKFDNDNPTIPDTKRLAEAVGLVNFREIKIDKSNVRLKQPGMSLNLGAIAKGYAVDKAMKVLEKNGVRHALINAGGDLKVMGQRKDGQPWNIGLQHPRQPEKMIASFALSDGAIATSGDYQKYFIKENTRYHHILNPKTGYPVSGVMSATVVTETVMDADALSTALFVMGTKKGLAFINSLKDVEGLLMNQDSTLHFSQGMKDLAGFSLARVKDNLSH